MRPPGAAGRPFTLRVLAGQGLRDADRGEDAVDPFVIAVVGEQGVESQPIYGGGRNCEFDFAADFVWKDESFIEFRVGDANEQQGDALIGRGELYLDDVGGQDWSGVVALSTGSGHDAGRLYVDILWHQVSKGKSKGSRAGAGELRGEEALKKHTAQLSEVIAQQHAARREDWAEFRTGEGALLGEVREVLQELRAERQRRIDLEDRLRDTEQWRQGASALQSDTLLARELREALRQRDAAQRSEDQAFRTAAHAQEAQERLREELDQGTHHIERHFAESELRMQAREAEVLGAAWRISGELRDELNAYRGEHARQGVSPPPAARSRLGAAQQALQDLRGVRQRYTELLKELPPSS